MFESLGGSDAAIAERKRRRRAAAAEKKERLAAIAAAAPKPEQAKAAAAAKTKAEANATATAESTEVCVESFSWVGPYNIFMFDCRRRRKRFCVPLWRMFRFRVDFST